MKKNLLFGLGLALVLSFGGSVETVLASSQVKGSEVTGTTYQTPTEVESRVREYFEDTPVMIEIARCESKFRQFTDSGNVLRGGSSGGMIGVFQFFESIHAEYAKELGFDIATLEGNLGYAKHVYETEGAVPWNSAKACWNVPIKPTTSPSSIANPSASKQEQIAMLMKLISLLQELLERQAKV